MKFKLIKQSMGSRKRNIIKDRKQYRVLSAPLPFSNLRVLVLEVFCPDKWNLQKPSHVSYNKIDGKKVWDSDHFGLPPLKHTDDAVELPNLIPYMKQIYNIK